MTDPLDKLKSTMESATPVPDVAARARILATAQQNFENFHAASQGSPEAARPTDNRSHAGVWKRMFGMFRSIRPLPAMLAGSSLAVIALGVVIVGQIPNLTDRAFREPLDTPEQTRAVEELLTRQDAKAPMVMLEIGPSDLDDAIAPSFQAPKHQSDMRQRAILRATADLVHPKVEAREMNERYPDATTNPLKITSDEPISTFSIDVDTASYAVMRSSILGGYDMPREAIRIEEIVNYFDYSYPVPDAAEQPFSVSVGVSQTPWNDGTQLMQIGIQGYDIDAATRDPMGLVFLIDTSGSMNQPNKLPLLIKSFETMLRSLNEDDTVAIVTYAGSAGVVLEPTRVSDMGAILGALSRLSAGGSTAGAAGLEQAYQVAASMQQDGQSARVILATDGDFNVGISGAAPLTEYIADKRESGIRLSVLGFGRGNYNDQTMQALAQNGNGVAAYIDTLAEADKVLSEEITGALITIASDVKIQVEFNPAQISEYRLVGYETRALNREDFNNDRVDAGDIGAGHSVTAIYEITPRGSDAEMVDAMRYQSEDMATSRDEYAFVKLRYKRPGETQSNLLELPVTADTDAIAPEDQDWASAVVGAARLMRGEDLGDWSLSDARDLATSARGNDPHGYRAEFMRLLGLLPE